MAAKTGAERSQKLRDDEKAAGIKRLVLKITDTERGWVQEGQDIGGFTDHTEFLLEAAKYYTENHAKL